MEASSEKNINLIDNKEINPELFDLLFKEDSEVPIIDVRSPAEFAKGHILHSKNIPLLDDLERAEIGTLYKQESPEIAFQRGLEIVGPKMAQFVSQANHYLKNKEGIVYCWRGGKRSNSMSWLFNMSGLNTKTISGGYKAYRKKVNEILESHPANLIVLGGKTGSGKTLLLHKLKEKGEQILDLEGLANHKGSAFGWIDERAQPSVELFENKLAHAIVNMDEDRVIWIENESRMIGKIPIHAEFWQRLKASPLVNIEIPTEARIKHLSQVYNADNINDLRIAFEKIKKRLGGLNLQLALKALDENDLESAAEIALLYYDKSYTKLLAANQANPIYRLNFEHGDFDTIANELITFKNKNILNAS